MNLQEVQAVDADGNTEGRFIRSRQYYTDSGAYVDEELDDRGYGHKYTWNENRGIITRALDQNDNATAYTYDTEDDYLTKVTKDGSTVNYTYNSDNYLTKIASGTTAYNFTYDQFGNVETSKIGTTQTLATNTYNDNNGNLKNTVYGNDFKLGYTYDLKDRITAAFHNGTAKFRWSHGADGQVGRHEDLVNGKTYQYTYDLAGRILRTDISDGSVIRMDYNDISLPTGIHYSIADEGGRDVYYTYAERDNLPKKTTFGSTREVVNTYDGLTRLDNTRYITPSADVADVVTDYTYRNYGDTTDRTTTFVDHIDYTYVSGGLTTNDRFYTYGPAGNILTESRGTSSNRILQEQYVYDAKGQVEKHYSVRNDETWVYAYDNAGNILSKKRYDGVTSLSELNAASGPSKTYTYTYSTGAWGDLLTKFDGKTVTSDAIGNMTAYNDQEWAWKGRQLDSYTSASGVKTSYKYNADGIRTQKKTGSKTTEYFLNGSQILMMKTTDGTTEDIIWFFYDSQGKRIGLCRNGTYMYYLYNLQGDVTAIASAGTGQIVAIYTYDTWGNCEVQELSGYAIGNLNPFRYRGYYWDSESGMYYLNSRYYSPEFGRFISADSQVNSDILGTNLFAYCSNNPVNRADTSGHAYGMIIGGLLGGFFGGLSAVLNGDSVGAGIITGALTGAVIGGICDGTTLVAGAVFGAMAKSAAVATLGNVTNQYLNYRIEHNQKNTSNSGVDSINSEASNYNSFADYYDPVETLTVATTTTLFVPLSVVGGSLVTSSFSNLEKNMVNNMGKLITEAAISGNVSTLQFAVEAIISVF